MKRKTINYEGLSIFVAKFGVIWSITAWDLCMFRPTPLNISHFLDCQRICTEASESESNELYSTFESELDLKMHVQNLRIPSP